MKLSESVPRQQLLSTAGWFSGLAALILLGRSTSHFERIFLPYTEAERRAVATRKIP